LQDRLDDDGGDLVRVLLGEGSDSGSPGRQLRIVGRTVEPGRRLRSEHLLLQRTGEQRMHPVHRIAHAHRREGVAVVPAAHRQHPGSPVVATGNLILDRQLDRDLDRHRARVAEEHVLQRIRRDLHQPLGQPDRRLVRQPAEHHVTEVVHLILHGRVQHRSAVAVDHAPPGRHRVDRLDRPAGPVVELQAYAGRASDQPDRRRLGQRGVRMPEQFRVPL
jgi:hypothetical protein